VPGRHHIGKGGAPLYYYLQDASALKHRQRVVSGCCLGLSCPRSRLHFPFMLLVCEVKPEPGLEVEYLFLSHSLLSYALSLPAAFPDARYAQCCGRVSKGTSS
jgi:hypothetical protein